MIKVKCLKSPDKEKQEEFHFFFDSITIGSKRKCDIYLKDKSIGKGELLLFAKTDKAIIKSTENDIFYKVNGKKISGTKVINIGDNFIIGDSQFTLVEVSEDWNNQASDMKVIEDAFNKLPEIRNLYEILEKEIIIAERDSSVQK